MSSPKEEVPNPRKDVQIIIHGSAEYDNDESYPSNFDDFVNKLFQAHQTEILRLFNSNENGLSYKSALKGFQFDSVEKQVR